MPPKKKPNSSSSSSSSIKKSNHNSNQPQPPSKFGIQHFFDRHTQTQNASQNPKPHLTSAAAAAVSAPVLTDRSNENGPASKKPDQKEAVSQNTPEENMVLVGVNAADENLSEVSPEVSKSVSLKRFKFSPGMVNFIVRILIFLCLVLIILINYYFWLVRVKFINLGVKFVVVDINIVI